MISRSTATEHTNRALGRCQTLARVSEMQSGILRQYLSTEHKQCNELTSLWMQEAGMQTWQDSVGNQWGRLVSNNPNAKSLLIGSHLDTVPNAGAYDGILGVMLAIELADLVNKNQLTLPFHLDVVGFCDEEGTRFNTTLIGSKALSDQFDQAWLALQDKDGISMQQAMLNFGLDPTQVKDAALKPEQLLGYWEVHIEQGPVLEAQDQALGVVTAIAGAKRALISFSGHSGHAGTTPMSLRHDALAAAAELTVNIEQLAKQCKHGEVATVGQLQVSPGATNVIAGYTEMSLDVRAQTDDALITLVEAIKTRAECIAEQRHLQLNWQWTHQAPAVQCDQKTIELFQQACAIADEQSPLLPSGAGHDAMAIAPICPVGMLFIRSPGGISHHPDESVIAEDITQAITVLYNALSVQGKTMI